MNERVATLAAGGIALLAGLGLWRYVEGERRAATGEDATAAWVVAARNLAAGTILAPEDLAIARFPLRTPPSSAVEGGALSVVAGQTLLRARRAGEPILWLDIPEGGNDLAHRVPVGERAVTITVSEPAGVGEHLKPRDRVDVYGILPAPAGASGTGGRAARLLLPNVVVLAAGAATLGGDWEASDGYATVTLAVKPAEVQLVALAQQEGELYLALRNPQDIEGLDPAAFPDVRTEHLYAPERLQELQRQQRERIAIYKAGLPAEE